jgi:hypothetical protein
LFVVITFGSCLAHAQGNCWGYQDFGGDPCTGPGGCSDTWEVITCGPGCTKGTCTNFGNSTSCCGVRHDYAQITNFPLGAECSGQSCGLAVRQLRLTAKQKLWGSLELDAALKKELKEKWPSRLPRMLYVINRCTHEYDLVYEMDIPSESKKGM